jgi:hypothetical protein
MNLGWLAVLALNDAGHADPKNDIDVFAGTVLTPDR